MTKEKKPRKHYPRETTARFSTDECKLLLMGMGYAARRDIFTNEGGDVPQRAGRIIHKLMDRIEKERVKKDKVLVEVKNEISS
jgi:hypothetical protein